LEKGNCFQAGFPGPDTMPEYHVEIAKNGPYGGRAGARTGGDRPVDEIVLDEVRGRTWTTRLSRSSAVRRKCGRTGTPWAEAMISKGRTPDRKRYRVCRDIFIADTDAEAKRLVRKTGANADLAQVSEGNLDVKIGLFDGIIHDSGIDITPDAIDEDFLVSST